MTIIFIVHASDYVSYKKIIQNKLQAAAFQIPVGLNLSILALCKNRTKEGKLIKVLSTSLL